MRLGIVRNAHYLVSVRDQTASLIAADCANIHEELGSNVGADRRIRRVVFQLAAGDEVLVQDFGVLCGPQSRPAQLLRDMVEARLTLCLCPSPGQVQRLSPDPAVMAVVRLLADSEREPRVEHFRGVHQGGSRKALSKYQIEYARKMFSDGESLRAISLLFQLPPSQVLDVVAPSGAQTVDADARNS